jgi:hypothetical protein
MPGTFYLMMHSRAMESTESAVCAWGKGRDTANPAINE